MLIFLSQIFLTALLVFLSLYPEKAKRKRFISLSFLLGTVFVFISIQVADVNKNTAIIESSPKNIIRSQKNWGIFLTEQSLPEIDKENEVIRSFFLQPEPINLAQSLWQETYLAKLNMYSSIILMTPEGNFLSHFSLNVPEIFFADLDLPPAEEWQIFRENISFLGKEKDFLIAYKDWYEEEFVIGRILLFISVDYESLPFLYSANPYFEVLRATSIPSLNQLDLGFAVFNIDGKLIFNPHKISTGIPPQILQTILSTDRPLWTTFTDKRKSYKSLNFIEQDRIYSLFILKKGFTAYLLEFLRILFMYLTLFLGMTFLITLISSKERIQKILWSFSNRVYIAFILVALIPLLLFTVSTRRFFANTFTQQMNEKAEIHAEFAQRVMEDYVFLELEEEASFLFPSDDIVLWISSTISNDVNLYLDGELVSSSRREFFDSGLLSEIINGETFYKMQYENNPFYTQVQKIGDYSFHTLTIPYPFQESLLLISLPFPFEEQELSKATKELLEFLFLISIFFILVVILFARGIGGMIIRPIKKLLAGTQQISMGNLEFSVEYKQQDEMKTLIEGFNKMVSDLKRHQQELADMSKKVAWAEMARKVAHEIKNPLTPIQLSAEHLLQVFEEDEKNFEKALKESTSYIINEVENLRKIAHEFMEISKESPLLQESVDLKEILSTAISQYKNILSHRIRFHESYMDDNIPFRGDRDKITIAFRNIFTNSIEAIQEKGEIKVSVKPDRPSYIRIEIEDTGIGIAEDILDHIFDAFFSTKDIGTGLGLPIAKKIIEDHNGSIKVMSKLKKGTRVIIKLPLKPEINNKNIPTPAENND
jgi:signal transduction histidine kinase